MRGPLPTSRHHKILLPVLIGVVLAGSCSSDKEKIMEAPKTIGLPSKPTSLGSARPGFSLEICVDDAGGGADAEYQFDFDPDGDGNLSPWLPDSCISHSWAAEGQYPVTARVRAFGLVSEWSEPLVVTIIDETIEPPIAPTGDSVVVVGEPAMLCGSGAVSSLGHTVEYRFVIDPPLDADWHISKCVSIPWQTPGVFRVRAQARCLLHPGIQSELSQSWGLQAVSAVSTQVLELAVAPALDGPWVDIDFSDEEPDTVSTNSWIRIVVEGSNPDYGFGTCEDVVNRCLGFQLQYEHFSPFVVNSRVTSDWLPTPPFDGNPNGTVDTLRLNLGPLNYTLRGRANDEFGADPEPPELDIVGNYAPLLTDYYIQNHDGTIVRYGDTVLWDWWAPANSDTVNEANGERKKRFSFLIKGTGQDDPRDPVGSAVKTWNYLFIAADDPIYFGEFARASLRDWVEGSQVNALCDTFTWEVTYPIDDVDGDAIFASLPPWINRTWDFTIRGRDSAPGDTYEQWVFVGGQKQLIGSYNAANLGRRTPNGFQRFSIAIQR